MLRMMLNKLRNDNIIYYFGIYENPINATCRISIIQRINHKKYAITLDVNNQMTYNDIMTMIKHELITNYITHINSIEV